MKQEFSITWEHIREIEKDVEFIGEDLKRRLKEEAAKDPTSKKTLALAHRLRNNNEVKKSLKWAREAREEYERNGVQA